MKKAMGTTLEGVEPAFYTWLHERFDPIIAARDVPDGVVLAGPVPTDTLEKIAGDHPGYYDAQLRLGEARAEPGTRWRLPRVATRRGAAADGHGRRGPARADCEAGDGEGRQRRCNRGTRGHARARGRQRRSRAAAGGTAGRRRRPLRAAKAWARVAEIDPFDATASAILGRQALDSRDAESAARVVPRGARRRAVGIGRPRTAIWLRVIWLPARRRRRSDRCSRRSRSRRPTRERRTCCSRSWTGAGDAPPRRSRARSPRGRRGDRREPPRVGPGARNRHSSSAATTGTRSRGWRVSSGASCA